MADRRSRSIGAKASLGRTGYPSIRSATGGELQIVTGPAQAGFNPLDLLLASLAACVSMSARIAARELGFSDAFVGLEVDVSGEKSTDEPSHFVSFTVRMTFRGEMPSEQQWMIARRAEETCTVSNSLAVHPRLLLGPA
ncbi:MAG: OsmC family protein [Allorhizobium sp.]